MSARSRGIWLMTKRSSGHPLCTTISLPTRQAGRAGAENLRRRFRRHQTTTQKKSRFDYNVESDSDTDGDDGEREDEGVGGDDSRGGDDSGDSHDK